MSVNTPLRANWVVYMILCDDDSLYTGITNNLHRRFSQHQQAKGAKYFRAKRAVSLVYFEDCHDRSSASKRESAIKQLKPKDKKALITSETNKIDSMRPPVTASSKIPHATISAP